MKIFKSRNDITLDKKQPIFVGIDVHRNQWHVTCTQGDEVIDRCTMVPIVEQLLKRLNKFKGLEVYTVYEAGFTGFYLHKELKKHGVNNIVCAPNRIPKESGNLVKTDKRDSLKLATCLKNKSIKGIHIPTDNQLNHREILRMRRQFSSDKTRVINRIKSMLIQYDIKIDVVGIPKKVRRELLKLDLPDKILMMVRLNLELLEKLEETISEIDASLDAQMETEHYKANFLLLRTIPGIGRICAAALLMEIGDFTRFSNTKKLASYLGLTPSEFSSGEKVRRGHITGQKNAWLRGLLIEASWKLVSKDPIMSQKFHRIWGGKGSKKRAIVAIARRLIICIRAMMLSNETFDSNRMAA